MIQSKSSDDPWYGKAPRVAKAHPTLSLPDAMYLARFSEDECKERAIQMRVCRLLPSKPKDIPHCAIID